MPTYEYICTDCNEHYDIFHKVREITEDVICPGCLSTHHKRVMSVTALSIAGTPTSLHSDSSPSCESGSCCLSAG